jgi:uncharacterized membrane protein
MMNKKKNKIKNTIKTYLNSEEGKILDSDILKTAIALGIIGISTPDISYAQGVHTNYTTFKAHYSHVSHGSHSSHGSHASHGSHGSHGSHARGGWCF